MTGLAGRGGPRRRLPAGAQGHAGAVPRAGVRGPRLRVGHQRRRPVERRRRSSRRVGIADVATRPHRRARRTTGPSSTGPSAPPAARSALWSVYVPNGREPGHAALRLQAGVAGRAARRRSPPSSPPTSRSPCSATSTSPPPTSDVWDLAAFDGPTHVTAAGARRRSRTLRGLGLDDVIPRAMKYDHQLHLLGLPRRQLPQEPRHAHRPRLRATRRSPTRSPTPTSTARRARALKDGKGPSDHAPRRRRPHPLEPPACHAFGQGCPNAWQDTVSPPVGWARMPLDVRPIDARDPPRVRRPSARASFLQCPSWAGVKAEWGHLSLGWYDGPSLVGAGLVLLRRTPGLERYLAYLPEGPVLDWTALRAARRAQSRSGAR